MRSGLKYALYLNQWKQLYEYGFSFREISELYGVDAKTINRTLDGVVEIRPKSKFEIYADEWLQLYTVQGLTKAEIARRYNTATSVVSSQLKKKGIETKSVIKKKKYEHLKEDFARKYQDGGSLGDIANEYDIDKQTVLNYLKEMDVEIRSLSESIRYHKLNEHYFDAIDSQRKAYHLGLIFGTASLLRVHNGYAVQISLHRKKREIIEPVFVALRGEDARMGYLGSDETYRMRIHSQHLFSVLSDYGLNSRKDLKMPNLKEDMMPAFIFGFFETRSYFDKRNYRISITGTEKFLVDIKTVVLKHVGLEDDDIKVQLIESHNHYRLTIQRKEVVTKVTEWLLFQSSKLLK